MGFSETLKNIRNTTNFVRKRNTIIWQYIYKYSRMKSEKIDADEIETLIFFPKFP